MKNLIFVISFCAFFSFSFVSSNFFTSENNYPYSDLSKISLNSENLNTKNEINFKKIHSAEMYNSNDDIDNVQKINNLFENDSNLKNLNAAGRKDITVDPPVSPLKTVGEMFNERGFYKSNSFSFEDQEIINDFNGNLMYSMPLYSYALGGDLNLNMKLTYNGSINHNLNVSSVYYQNNGSLNRFNNRYTMNFPEWIVDINGFAVQIFNFETNFFDSSGGSSLTGSEVNAVIPGYHFDNELRENSEINKDRINVMAGDGSVISLENNDYDNNDLAKNYIGNYSYKGKELHYKAIVTYKYESYGSESPIGYRERNMILLTGDGLEYFFEEKKKNFEDYNTDRIISNARINPMMMYLKEIRDRFGRILHLDYTSDIPQSIPETEIIMGRDLLQQISYSGISSTIPSVSISLEYGPNRVTLYHNSELNGNYTLIFVSPVNYRPYGDNNNQRASISKVLNILNQSAEFEYEVYTRKYTNVYNPFASSSNQLELNLNDLKRINSVTNSLGLQRDYTYIDNGNITIDLIPFLNGEDNRKYVKTNTSIYPGYYLGMGRDAFFTNILTGKSEFEEVLKSTSSFSYEYDFNGRTDIDEIPVKESDKYYSFKTIISENHPSWDTISNSRVHREYKMYPLYDSANHFAYTPDTDGTTKLMKEEVLDYANPSILLKSNKFTYEEGIYSSLPAGYNGSFLMKTKRDSLPGISEIKEWKWDYIYNIYSNNHLVSQTKETDPFNNYTITNDTSYFVKYWHKKFVSDYTYYSALDSSYYYKIGIPLSKYRVSSLNDTMQKSTFEYLENLYTHDTVTNKGYFGQLVSEKTYEAPNFSNYIETKYEYCKNDTSGKHLFTGTGIFPSKEGNLKLTITNNRETRFYYNPISLSEVFKNNLINSDYPDGMPLLKYKVKYNNGDVLDTFSMIWDHRFPIRIDNNIIENNISEVLSTTYKTYTLDGSPSKIIDQNKYLTQFVYQPIHRINSVTLPGDFSTQKDSVFISIDTLTLYNEIKIKGKVFGNYNFKDDTLRFTNNNDALWTSRCPIFNANISSDSFGLDFINHPAYIKIDTSEVKYLVNFDNIDSAYLDVFPYSKSFLVDGKETDDDIKTIIRIVESISPNVTDYDCYPSDDFLKRIPGIDIGNTMLGNFIDIPAPYSLNRFDIKNLIQNNSTFTGILISPILDVPSDPPPHELFVQFTGFNNVNDRIYWENNYAPYFVVKGRENISDTLKIPIIKGGTIKYNYDDDNHKIDVYSVRNSLLNESSRIKYSVDMFGNIKQKDIYTDGSNVNSYKYKFNYLNNPSENLDALSQSTKFSYDGLGRLKKTTNADLSFTLTSFNYLSSLTYFFGNITGFFEKQIFTDEEGNNFEKYIDAVGNLLVEKKYILIDPGSGPVLEPLNTEYKYDSLYRISKVKTPEGKLIHYYYDGYGRQSKRITPDAGQTEYIYDKNSNLTYSQDANQRTTDANKYSFRNYDGLKRLTGIGENVFLDDSPANGDQFNSTNPDLYLTVNVYDTITSAIVNSLFTVPYNYTSPVYTNGNLVSTAYRTNFGDPWNFKYYKYDVRGRVIKMWNIISGFDTLVTLYNYNSQDQITNYSHIRQGIKVSYNNIYDYSGRLSKVEKLTLPDNPNTDFINLSEYEYNENSLVSQQQLNEGSVTNLYFYNNRNWIAEMIQYEDYFAYLNGYFKNGNVKTQQLSGSYNDNFEVSSDLNYEYSYDQSNRLLYSKTSDTILETENSYDKDGNILTLQRTNGNGGVLDNFTYNYYSGTNKLQNVTGSGNQFTYDSNGNLITDALNNNETLYDHRNLITTLKHKSQIIEDPVYITKYYYDESGNRIRKMTYEFLDTFHIKDPPINSDVSDTNKWELQNDEIYSRDVSGKELAIYKNNEIPEYPIYGLDMIGKIRDDDVYVYMKDHLGSVRAVLKDYNIVSAQDYDAWGYIYGERSYESSESKFKFTGKERDEESFYDYFGARYYDGRVGRWGSLDPLMEKHADYSPYNYVLDNPQVLIDPKGEQVFVAFSGFAGISGKAINPSDYSQESSVGTEVLLYNISKYSQDNDIKNLKMIGYYASPLEQEVAEAFDFILNNLVGDEPIILYGTSLGGANINDLANQLINNGIQNQIILITVDAFRPLSDIEGLTISSDVSINYNFYQKQEGFLGSRGYPSKSKSENVINMYVPNVDHYNIDDETNLTVSGIIMGYIHRWRNR